MIPDLDPQKLAQREIQQKAEIANMAIKFTIAMCSGPTVGRTDPADVARYALALAEILHGYVTMPPAQGNIS